jgi:ABC-2 type transport system permease protein
MTTESSFAQLSWYRRMSIGSVLSKSLFDRLGLTLAIGLGLGAMAFFVAALYPSLEETLLDIDLPDSMDAFLAGSDLASPVGWMTAEIYSIMAPLAIVALAIVDGAKSIAAEEEERSIGLLAANPVSRARLLVDKSTAIVVHVVVASVLSWLLLWAGVVAFDIDLTAGNLAAATLHLALLGTMFAGAIVLVSALTGHRVRSMLIVGSLAGLAYVVAAFLPLSDSFGVWAKLSPWYYYLGNTNPLESGVDWGGIGIMAAIAAVLFVAAGYVFTRRDLPG